MNRGIFRSQVSVFTYLLLIILSISITGCVASKNDLGQSKSAKEWIEVCANDTNDIYCKSAKDLLKDYDNPIVFLHPNAGGSAITKYLRDTYNSEAENYVNKIVKSNIFIEEDLITGTMTAFDGSKRKVICRKNSENCTIDNLVGSRVTSNRTPEEYNGMVYITTNLKKVWPHFLLP